MTRRQKRMLVRILAAGVLFVAALLIPASGWTEILLFLLPFLVAGSDIIVSAVRNILHGQFLDENFLMSIASLGAFACGECTEGVAVMLFYQIGELFQSCAVARSRRSIAALMDICPEYANVEKDGCLLQVDPETVEVGSEILVKPGEKIPIDGVIIQGESTLNTAALTGESIPRSVCEGDEVCSGCINMSGPLHIRTTKEYGQSTVAKIIELVESASNRKAATENFITKFARWYTPCVVAIAAILAIVPPLISGNWITWVHRALIFLVISCPCALVISVPLSFFGGIGGASRAGILMKGGNYMEVLAAAETVIFDKTGTLTKGELKLQNVTALGISEDEYLTIAAHAEMYSDHPIARCIVDACPCSIQSERVKDIRESAGKGISALVDDKHVLIGNAKLMQENSVPYYDTDCHGTVVHMAVDGHYAGYMCISDSIREEATEAINTLRHVGVRKIVILTGDAIAAAQYTAESLGADEVYAELLPGDKVDLFEKILSDKHTGRVLFVGDGINDAPVLRRADAGIAMGAMGSDAAIEAADVVLMEDNLLKIPQAIEIARKTMRIVRQNIIFAIGVKVLIMLLGALGLAGMWAAVFADVGVAVLAILNASRALQIPRDI